MIEDVLAEMSAGGFVVSNVFQVTATDGDYPFGPTGWKVHLRNVRNTRTGSAEATTLEGALKGALAKANEGPAYERPPRSEANIAKRHEEYQKAYAARPQHPI